MNLQRSVLSIAIALAVGSTAGAGAALAAPPDERVDAAPPAPPRDASTTLDRLVAVPGGLQADTVAQRAVATSPSLAAKRAEVVAAAAEVERAKWGFLPKLTGTARYTRLSSMGSSDLGRIVVAPDAPEGPLAPDAQLANVALAIEESPLDQYTLSASLSVPISDYLLRFPQGLDAARLDESAARFGEEATRLQAGAEARLAYYAWARARLQHAVAEESLAQSKLHLADVLAGEEAGSSSRADVMRVRSQVAQSELLVRRGRDLEDATLDLLRTVMHDERGTTFQIGEDLRVDAGALAGPTDVGALLADAIRRRPELRALEASAASTRRRGTPFARRTRRASTPWARPFWRAPTSAPSLRSPSWPAAGARASR